jgi:hypothetical protein
VELVHVPILGTDVDGGGLESLHAGENLPLNRSTEVSLVARSGIETIPGPTFQDIRDYEKIVVRTCYDKQLLRRMRRFSLLSKKQRSWAVRHVRSILYCETGRSIPYPICRVIAGSFQY